MQQSVVLVAARFCNERLREKLRGMVFWGGLGAQGAKGVARKDGRQRVVQHQLCMPFSGRGRREFQCELPHNRSEDHNRQLRPNPRAVEAQILCCPKAEQYRWYFTRPTSPRKHTALDVVCPVFRDIDETNMVDALRGPASFSRSPPEASGLNALAYGNGNIDGIFSFELAPRLGPSSPPMVAFMAPCRARNNPRADFCESPFAFGICAPLVVRSVSP